MTPIKNYRARHIQLAIRTAVRVDHGAERVVIGRDGSVHAFGRMPNADKTGWFFAGHDRDIMAGIHASVAAKTNT